MGGTDDPTNLQELSIEEHALEHKKLFEKYGHWQDYLAWKGLSGRLTKEDIIRQKIIKSNNSRKNNPKFSGENNPFYGKTHSDKVKEIISNTNRGNTYRLGKKHTEESKNNIKFNHSDFSGENNPFYGKNHSNEVKERIKKFMLENNPSKGTIWVNNGEVNKRIKSNSEMPIGFNVGKLKRK